MLQNSLESYLSCFAKYGSYVHRLLCFEEESICGSCDLSITDPNSLTCQTYQAFANAISNFIKSLRKELTIIEKKIIQQGRWKFCRFLEWLDIIHFHIDISVFTLRLWIYTVLISFEMDFEKHQVFLS